MMPSMKAQGLGRYWGRVHESHPEPIFLRNNLLPLSLGLQEKFFKWLLYNSYSLNKRP